MGENFFNILKNGKVEDCIPKVEEFNKKYNSSFSFSNLHNPSKKEFIEKIVSCIRSVPSPNEGQLITCITALRILSRDKEDMGELVSETTLSTLTHLASLGANSLDISVATALQVQVILEAQKCLSNIILNNVYAARICSGNGCVEGIVNRLKTYKSPGLNHDIKFFDLRILFLLTTLVNDVRPRLRHDLHGFTYLIEVLDLILQSSNERVDSDADTPTPDPASGEAPPLTQRDVQLASEVLKILFNVTISVDKNNLDEEEEAHFMRLVSILHDILLADVDTEERKEELQSHTVNLLTNLPRVSYEELLTPIVDGHSPDVRMLEYDGKNMEAVIAILNFFEGRLNRVPKSDIKEHLIPILQCLCECCRGNRHIRKFCRLKIIPYMKDEVRNLPEEGESLRNKLCRLLTNPVKTVKDLTADLLFILCKENVSRFVKYTGYGNAAGLLAQRGLMCGGKGREYSSESDDSETDEYTDLKEGINPITGRYEERQINPMEGMSDEQKEYEAMKLVNQLDKLTRHGVVQPSTIGPDGRPMAIEHVSQLTKNIDLNDSPEDAGDE